MTKNCDHICEKGAIALQKANKNKDGIPSCTRVTSQIIVQSTIFNWGNKVQH